MLKISYNYDKVLLKNTVLLSARLYNIYCLKLRKNSFILRELAKDIGLDTAIFSLILFCGVSLISVSFFRMLYLILLMGLYLVAIWFKVVDPEEKRIFFHLLTEAK
jgi:hypothetical protein